MKKLTQYIDERLKLNKNTIIHKTHLNLNDFVEKYSLEKDNNTDQSAKSFSSAIYKFTENTPIDIYKKLRRTRESKFHKSEDKFNNEFNLKEKNWELSYDYDDLYDRYYTFSLYKKDEDQIGLTQLGYVKITRRIMIYYWRDETETFGYKSYLTSDDMIQFETAIFTWINYLLT